MGTNSNTGGGNSLVTPSTRLLNQKLGTSPAPRTLQPSEIELLRRSKQEIARAVREMTAQPMRSTPAPLAP